MADIYFFIEPLLHKTYYTILDEERPCLITKHIWYIVLGPSAH